MTIFQTFLMKIVSIDMTHNVLFNNEYIMRLQCIFKIVRAYLGEQC